MTKYGNHCHQTEKRMNRNEDSVRDLQHNIKCANVCIIGDTEGERKREDENKLLN